MKSFYRITSYEQEEAKYKVRNDKQAFVHIQREIMYTFLVQTDMQ